MAAKPLRTLTTYAGDNILWRTGFVEAKDGGEATKAFPASPRLERDGREAIEAMRTGGATGRDCRLLPRRRP
jgi:hypothetical protein